MSAAAPAPRVYTAAELTVPTRRPRIMRRGDSARVLGARKADPGRVARYVYAVPSPCCGAVTLVPEINARRMNGPDFLACGKPYYGGRGRGRACAAVYQFTTEEPAEGSGLVFVMTWTGR